MSSAENLVAENKKLAQHMRENRKSWTAYFKSKETHAHRGENKDIICEARATFSRPDNKVQKPILAFSFQIHLKNMSTRSRISVSCMDWWGTIILEFEFQNVLIGI